MTPRPDWRTTRCMDLCCDHEWILDAPRVGEVVSCPRCGTTKKVIDVCAPYYVRCAIIDATEET